MLKWLQEDSPSIALQSLLGGVGIALATHELLLLTGNVFGISGFVHRGVNGNSESLAGLAGLVLGGIVVATMEGGAISMPLSTSPSWLVLSGLLVGIGSKVCPSLMLSWRLGNRCIQLANGCTSGCVSSRSSEMD